MIGIDISKESFDAAYEEKEGIKTKKYAYTEEGIRLFISQMDKSGHCVMESTGVYHLRLAHALYDSGFSLSVVNPLSVKRYIQSKMSRSKTDKGDSIQLIDYGRHIELADWEPEPVYYTQAQQLLNVQSQLIKDQTSVRNQIEAITLSVHQSSAALGLLNKHLEFIEHQLKETKTELERLMNTYHKEDTQNLESIPGIGRKTATALLVYTKGMKNFETSKNVISYFGLSPRTEESGTSVKRRSHICKMGMGHIRMLLYMCARSAKKYNKSCRDLYERLLAKGKAKKCALIAVANKLIKQAFAIIKNKTPYDENFLINKVG